MNSSVLHVKEFLQILVVEMSSVLGYYLPLVSLYR